MNRIIIGIAWVILLAVGACQKKRATAKEPQKHFNSIHEERFSNTTPVQLKSDFQLLNLRTMEQVAFSSLGDSLLIVSFWEYFCKPCIKELPSLVMLKKSLNVKSCRILLISERYPDKILASPVFENRDVEFYHVGYSKYDSAFDNDTDFIPRTYFVDSKGKTIFYDYMGGTNYNDSTLAGLINKYFSNQTK
jgi:thiol-disulfide isomerase/thioredoxin